MKKYQVIAFLCNIFTFFLLTGQVRKKLFRLMLFRGNSKKLKKNTMRPGSISLSGFLFFCKNL